MARVAKEKKEDKSVEVISPEQQAAAFLQNNKEDHLNFEEVCADYKVSTGSLLADMALSGGFGQGLHRLGGISEGGKSSFALEVARNFFNQFENGRCCYFKAEGRLSPEMQKRCGLNFVWNPKDWKAGTVLVFETNIFETILNFMSDMTVNNPGKVRYMFIIDSLDSVILKKDSMKSLEGDSKVAGVPKLFKQYCQKVANGFSRRGHMLFIISQRSASIQIDPYAPKERKLMEASGGHSAEHNPNWVLEFQARNASDMILEDPTQKFDIIKNKYVGHEVRIKVKKSVNETTGTEIKYPIRYGAVGKSSVWVSREIGDMLLAFEMVKRGGAWLTFTEEFRKDCLDNGFEVPEKMQGLDNFYSFLEKDQAFLDYLYAKIKNILI